MAQVKQDSLTAYQKDFMERAKNADKELEKIQKKYHVELSPKSKFQYNDTGIGVVTEVIWSDAKASKSKSR